MRLKDLVHLASLAPEIVITDQKEKLLPGGTIKRQSITYLDWRPLQRSRDSVLCCGYRIKKPMVSETYYF